MYQTSQLSHWPILKSLPKEFPQFNRFFIFNQGRSALLLDTRDSCVYAFGHNRLGCLGLGCEDGANLTEPNEIVELRGKTIVEVVEGDGHVMALVRDNNNNQVAQEGDEKKKGYDLYGWGCNGTGQVGCGGTEFQTKPVKVASGVMQVSCGIDHSAWLDCDGSVWCAGDDGYDQMGKCSEGYGAMPAKVVETIGTKHITQISCGAGSCLALSTESKLYIWGYLYPEGHSIPTQIPLAADLIPMSITAGHQDFLLQDSAHKVYHGYYGEDDLKFHLDPLTEKYLKEPVKKMIFGNISHQSKYCLELDSGKIVIWNPMSRELEQTEFKSIVDACAVLCPPSVTPGLTDYVQSD